MKLSFNPDGELVEIKSYLAEWIKIELFSLRKPVVLSINDDEAFMIISEPDSDDEKHSTETSLGEFQATVMQHFFPLQHSRRAYSSRYIWLYHDKKERVLLFVKFSGLEDPLEISFDVYDLRKPREFPSFSWGSNRKKIRKAEITNFSLPVLGIVRNDGNCDSSAFKESVRRRAEKIEPPYVLKGDEDRNMAALFSQRMAESHLKTLWYARMALGRILAHIAANDEESSFVEL